MVISQFDVCLVNLDPTVGSEMRKTRPCLVISPDEINRHLRTLMIAPMTTKSRPYPTRVACQFRRKKGFVVLDQMRTIDRVRVIQRLGQLDDKTTMLVLSVLQQLFAI
jgi:mRNA interferase MazF